MTEATENKKQPFVIFPILIWLATWILGLMYLVPYFSTYNSEEAWVFGIVFSLFERLGVAICTLHIVKKWRLDTNLWPILALIFGLNQLLFLNIAIWIKASQPSKT
jgi:membrane protein CcdC involved in cytochrome C biogenesis